MASSGNFCTLNPLTEYDSRMNRGNYSNGNLTYDDVGGDGWIANMAMTHKTYCEYRIDGLGGYGGVQGLRGTQAASQVYDSVTFQASYQSGRIYHYKGDSDQSYSGNIGGTVSSGNIIMFAYDPATYKWWVGVNGTWRNSGDPANGTGYVFEGSATMFENMDVTWGGWSGDVNRLDHTWNFGQDSTFGGQETAGGNADGNGFGDFAYAPPTGFLALCTGNMSVSDDIDPAQTNSNYPSKNFNVVTYTGDGSTSNAISNLGFSPDMVWIGQRSSPTADYSNGIWDTTRGRAKVFYSHRTNAEPSDSSSTQDLVSFDSDGFTVGTNNNASVNASSKEMVAWCWKAGGAASSDDSGDITVSRSTNSASKFTIATWTGNGSSGSTIAHGLGVKPAMTFIKKLDATSATNVWHQGNNDGDPDSFGELSSTSSWYQNQGASGPYTTAPTTSLLTLTAYGQVNGSSNTYVGYFWADVEGMQKFGSFEGNANNDGPFIYTGFRPRMVFIKSVDTTAPWLVWDTVRNTFNPANNGLAWNDGAAESDYTGYPADILSNGFKLRSSNATINASGTWIYGAWGDVPFKYNNTF